MDHPFLNINNIKAQLTPEEIQSKLSSLLKRSNFAYKMGNQQMINQIVMMQETYTRAYQEKMDELYGKDADDKDLDGKIDIS